MNKINTQDLFNAKKNLNDFLTEHPELKDLQEQIDKILEKAGNNSANRNIALQQFMMEFVKKLNENFSELRTTCESVADKNSHLTLEKKD